MRNLLLFALVAGLLWLVPIAAAQPAGLSVTKATDHVQETSSGITATEALEFNVTSAPAFLAAPVIRFLLDPDAPRPTVQVEVAGKPPATVDPARVKSVASSASGLPTFEANLTGMLGGLKNGDRVVLTSVHPVADATYRHGFAYAVPQAIVYATPLNGHAPKSTELGAFNPTLNGDEEHAVKTNVAAGFSYSLTFAAVGVAATPTNLNPYLVGGLGLVVGFVLAWSLFTRGKKGKKFEKGGEMESGAMLEARRRTLMAALKELELAHEAKEISDAAYAPLKEEYKAQTVRVLRSLEEKKEAPRT
jgi:hypothetical protein